MEFTTGRNGRTSALPGCPLARSLSPAVSVSRKTAGSIPRPRLSTTRGASTLSPKISLTTSTMLEVRRHYTCLSTDLLFLSSHRSLRGRCRGDHHQPGLLSRQEDGSLLSVRLKVRLKELGNIWNSFLQSDYKTKVPFSIIIADKKHFLHSI